MGGDGGRWGMRGCVEGGGDARGGDGDARGGNGGVMGAMGGEDVR